MRPLTQKTKILTNSVLSRRFGKYSFQKAWTKIEVVLTLPCWLSQLNWDSQQGRVRTTSILVWAFWKLKLKVLKYSRNCSLQYTLIPWSLKKCDTPYCICLMFFLEKFSPACLMFVKNFPICTFISSCTSIRYTRVYNGHWEISIPFITWLTLILAWIQFWIKIKLVFWFF